MQRLFAEETAWRTPWIRRVLPEVVRLCEHGPERTCFTRFIPAARPGEGVGTWRGYYERWSSMTLEALEPGLVDLVPELALFTPPALVFDKRVYSPWLSGDLQGLLRERGADTLVVSGGETDVCVLATVLGAVDLGYRVVIAVDALCSSSNETHDATVSLYHDRYGQQIETATCDEILDGW
ncbi:cysteine hydrolase [Brevundimonas sp. Root1423]|nr:cysteine hydrolase [Brevundimonas sp. Root1423]KRA22820.1 cysteine hydrolase [Brevundimonas sp. Root608]